MALDTCTAPVERIHGAQGCLAIVIRGDWSPSTTSFLTPPEHTQQLGFIVYPAGHEIPRHVHRPIERQIIGTCEILVVRQGSVEIDLYDDDRTLVATPVLEQGDVIILLAGGHGLRMREDAVLMEVKQGPYVGLDEKERF